MPIPFILGAAALGAAAFGVKKGYDAKVKNDEAREIYDDAEALVNSAKSDVEKARGEANESLESLGQAKLDVVQNTLEPFWNTFKKIKHIEVSQSFGMDELNSDFSEKMKQLGDMDNLINALGGGALGGVAAGGLVALGAYGAIGTFGVASTGAAISGLAGAAATNATLAWLGGGSLAAGGLGVAGGTAVLGGIVAGPALAIMGCVMNAKAEENFYKAKREYKKAEGIAEELKTAATMCKSIAKRGDMFKMQLRKLAEEKMNGLNCNLSAIVAQKTDYRTFTDVEKNVVAASVSTAVAIKSILDTPLLSEEGRLTDESEKLLATF